MIWGSEPLFWHKSMVYKFGNLWFWKCRVPWCHGGRSRDWACALHQANVHVISHIVGDK